ncbi:MarR family winged helix-turn-helix transcriptional regulator [Agromyces sp. MMS24-JH15]|uniref:MarR family winged helix-turn-helix transcriptional regulator n=1 Tax=Agromyces sp. MMS24-JH15 TaxID=3243765 RepID=UPI0037495A71
MSDSPHDPATSPLGDRVTVTLHLLVDRLDAFADGHLRRRFGLTYSQFMVLAVLADIERPGHPDLTELAECLRISKAAVSKRLPSFVTAGWVRTAPDPADGRRLVVALTDEGRELVLRATAELDDSFTELFDDAEFDLGALHRDLGTLLALLRTKGT